MQVENNSLNVVFFSQSKSIVSSVSLAELVGQLYYIYRGPGFEPDHPLIHLKGEISSHWANKQKKYSG
jgi:hypothetical protein